MTAATRTRAKAQQAILYSTTLHTWEVWQQSRPLAQGSLEACQQAYPNAIGPSEDQIRLAEQDGQ